jgi:protease secretion system membrane fusion protein
MSNQVVPAVATGASTAETHLDTSAALHSQRPSHIGFWALALGFTAFVGWAAWAPLDEGVASPGVVTIDTKHKNVQHLTGGIVKDVLVREGQEVKKGDVLMRLDDVASRANFESVRQRYLSMRAVQNRLQAEQSGGTSIIWHPDLTKEASDPLIRQQMSTQQQLFNARRASLAADLQATEESIHGQEEMIQSYTNVAQNRRHTLALLQEELTNTKGLIEQGYVPRNRQLELERSVSENRASAAEIEGSILRARRAIAELHQRTQVRQQDYRKEVESQLGDVSRDVLGEGERLKALRDDLSRTEVRAPADGQVVGLNFQTPGGIIPPGQRIADIVPEDGQLLLEAQVAPHLIDRVKQGQSVDVRFNSFANSPQLVVQGVVQSISGDALPNSQGNATYYLARVAVTEEGIKKLGTRHMQAGMPVEVVFKGGERSLLTYLLHPLLKRMAASMKEE